MKILASCNKSPEDMSQLKLKEKTFGQSSGTINLMIRFPQILVIFLLSLNSLR